MHITDFAGVNLQGKSFSIPTDHAFNFKTYVDPNDPGTFTWTISGAYEITAGGLTSNTVTIKWATPGSYSVSVVYVGGGNTLTSSTTVAAVAGFTDIPSQECSTEAGKASTGAQTPTFIDFVNRTQTTIKLYWINYSGQRTLISTFAPGAGTRVTMWMGFPWVITDNNDGCMGVYEPVATPGRVTVINVETVQTEKFATDNLDLTLNPNAGGGQRIYPDRKLPGESASDALNRKRVRVRAKLSYYVPNTKIYFRNFDVDDPSASSAPVDDDSGTKINDPDNRGDVGGSKTGQLDSPPSPLPQCIAADGVLECPTDASGIALADFTVTMNPGDNFAISASTNKTQLLATTQAGTDLKNPVGTVLPVPPNQSTPAALGLVARSEMLTVWRKLYLEVDSMGNVGTGNKLTGTIASSTSVSPTCPSPNTPPTCWSPATVYEITGGGLEVQRFNNGRIAIGSKQFDVWENSATHIVIKGVANGATNNMAGKSFTVYDDDDYNANDTVKDGDNNEALTQFADTFENLSAADGTYADGRPRNLYGNAYIMPDYTWAAGVALNQTNLQFELNVEDGVNNATLINVVTRDRGSDSAEKDDFWVGYVLIGYQGPLLADFDGLNPTGTTMEAATLGAAPNQWLLASEIPSCDCYNSPSCPGGTACVLNGNPIIPRGALGSIVHQELSQDMRRYFLAPPPPVTARTLLESRKTPVHEIGHQFGLLGDQTRTLFGIMDYSNYVGNVVNPETLHPEHINIMRSRIKSPGK